MAVLRELLGPPRAAVRPVDWREVRSLLGSHDAEAAWRAITDPVAVDRWLGWHPAGPGHPGRIDLMPGGMIVVPYCYPVNKGPRIMRNATVGTVKAVKDREVIEYVIPGMDGPQATTRWLLRACTDGTAVSLRYACQVRDRLPYVLADWHCRLDALARVLDDEDPAGAWSAYAARYESYSAAMQRA